MRLSKFLALLCILPLMACTAAGVENANTQQKLYATVTDYKTVQEAALAYKALCESGQLVNQSCKTYVKKIAEYNSKGNSLIQSTGGNFADTGYNASITQALLILTTQLSAYLVEAQQKEIRP